MEQWYLDIRSYAKEMLEDLDRLDWPQAVKESQKGWIGLEQGRKIPVMINGKINYVFVKEDWLEGLSQPAYLALSIDDVPDHLKPEGFEEYQKRVNDLKLKNVNLRDIQSLEPGLLLQKKAKFMGKELPAYIVSYIDDN